MLRLLVNGKQDPDQEVHYQIEQARNVFTQMKVRLCASQFRSQSTLILLYGAETWRHTGE